ncbi:beta-glucosidase 12-like [Diospyros lotus]|uniref:beta-glucosidase 12-like n=1 Tax=Diospyros lotus TaxID=55363 RepID=UPI002257D8C6|nr:beta-glucosidase 12-like [Diospyros lotus]
MAMQVGYLLLGFIVLANTLAQFETVRADFNRTSFPKGFVFGASSAAYQYEGAVNEGGRGKSIWDTFSHKYPSKIDDGSNGDVADDFYHRYKEDIQFMNGMGLDAFRLSISWPRVLPGGKLSGGVNKEGIAFYNNVINELLAKGVQPFVTIFHWDLPQVLEDEYGGFLSPKFLDDYQDFAELCFKEFGDRIKHWITFNEPYVFIGNGYDLGGFAPGRCSAYKNNNCPAGNSATEPYIAGHHLILAHAKAVKLYKEKYQATQKGQIGITLVSQWMLPYSNSILDKRAAYRALDFMYGWFLHPLVYGEYPRIMRALVANRLPKFTLAESKLVKGSYDFIGLNYYTANYAAHNPTPNKVNISSLTDNRVTLTTAKNGVSIGKPTGVGSFFSVPSGLKDLLIYGKEKYQNPTIYITENGIGDFDNQTVAQAIKDPHRIEFYREHLSAVLQAIYSGVDVKGFFAWSYLDTYEWSAGYTLRFGLNYVDYKDNQKRYPKDSAYWLKKFLLK